MCDMFNEHPSHHRIATSILKSSSLVALQVSRLLLNRCICLLTRGGTSSPRSDLSQRFALRNLLPLGCVAR